VINNKHWAFLSLWLIAIGSSPSYGESLPEALLLEHGAQERETFLKIERFLQLPVSDTTVLYSSKNRRYYIAKINEWKHPKVNRDGFYVMGIDKGCAYSYFDSVTWLKEEPVEIQNAYRRIGINTKKELESGSNNVQGRALKVIGVEWNIPKKGHSDSVTPSLRLIVEVDPGIYAKVDGDHRKCVVFPNSVEMLDTLSVNWMYQL